MKYRFKQMDIVLIIFMILTIVAVCMAKASEPVLSMYDAPSDKTKTVVECSWPDNSRKDERLIVKNTEVESDKVMRWFTTICLGRPY